MIMKILGAVLVIISSSYLGYQYSKTFTTKIKQIRNFQYILNVLESEIVYSSTPLVQAFEGIFRMNSDIVNRVFGNMASHLKKKDCEGPFEAFEKSYSELKGELYFSSEEIDVISAFLKTLSGSDIDGHRKNFDITKKKFEQFEKGAEDLRNKNERLYRYLGICGGILLVIILV